METEGFLLSSGFISSFDINLRRAIAITGMTSGVVQTTDYSVGIGEVLVFCEKFFIDLGDKSQFSTGMITSSFTFCLLWLWVV